MDFEKESIDTEKESVLDIGETYDDIEIDENSTVFTKSPKQVNVKNSVSTKKKKARTLILLIVAALVVGTGIFCAIKFIPENEEEQTETYSIKVKTVSSDKVDHIDIKNQYGEYEFVPVVTEETSSDSSESSTTINWKIKDANMSLLSVNSVNVVAENAISVYASREMDNKSSDYGFDNPYLTVNVVTKDSTDDFTLIVGKKSPDKTGYYIKISGDEKVYFAATGTVDNFDFRLEKLAETVIVNAPTLDDNTAKDDKKYFDDEGTIATFDYIELSGSNYGNKITVTPLGDNDMASYAVTTSEGTRYGDEEICANAFGIVSNGLVAIDTYKLSPKQSDIKQYGLDNPDAVVVIKYGTNTVKLKAHMYDTEQKYYAVMIDGIDAIYAVYTDALSMLEATESDYFNDNVFLEYYNAFSTVTIETSENKYVFKTAYDENAEEDKFTVELNNKTLDGDLFSAYYEHIVALAPEAQESYLSGSADYVATFVFNDTDKGTKRLELIKQSERRYLVVIDGMKMGLVSSSVYDNLVDYVENVVNGKGIPEP